MYGVEGKRLQRQHKDFLSGFREWEELPHASDWLIFPQNISKYLSIDEVALSQGELYTVVTSKKARGRAGSIVAIIEGTQAEKVIEHISKIDAKLRYNVKEITLDMANSMKLISTRCFPNAVQVTDRFHVQKLCIEAVQEIRVKHRWNAIDAENEAIRKTKESGKEYIPEVFLNGDTRKQLLARSRYLLYKSRDKWTNKQQIRAQILFEEYPDIELAYNLSNQLRVIYNNTEEHSKVDAMNKLALWYNDVEESGFKSFNTIMNTIKLNYTTILNYFDNRSTNAGAESFNAKIKAFRTQFRGVSNKEYFLYRLTEIYA